MQAFFKETIECTEKPKNVHNIHKITGIIQCQTRSTLTLCQVSTGCCTPWLSAAHKV